MRLNVTFKTAAAIGIAAIFVSSSLAQQPLDIVWEATQNKNTPAVAHIPGSGLVAVARYNKVEIRQWSDGSVVRVIDPLINGATQIAARSLSANSNGLIAGAAGTTVFLADAFTGRLIQSWPLTTNTTVTASAMSPDGNLMAFTGNAGTGLPRIQIYNLNDLGAPPVGLLDTTTPVATTIRTIAFSPDSTQIFGAEDGQSAIAGGRLRVWNVTGGNPVWFRELTTIFQFQYSSIWNAGGIYHGTEFWSTNGRVYRLNPADGTDIDPPLVTTATTFALLSKGANGMVGAYSTAGHYGFSGNLATGPVIYSNTLSAGFGSTADVAGQPATMRYAAATTNRFAILDAQNPTTAGDPTVQFDTFSPTPTGFSVAVRMIAYAPDGSRIACGTTSSNNLRIYNAATGALNFDMTLSVGDQIRSVAFNPASTELAVGVFRSTAPSAIRRVDPATGTVVGSIDIAGDTTPVSVQYMNDGTRIMASNGTTTGRRIRIYNLDGSIFAESPQLGTASLLLTSAVLSPDNTRIAATSQGTSHRQLHILQIDAPNINLLASTTDQNSNALSCSWRPDSNLVAVGFAYLLANGGSRVAVYDATDLTAPPVEVGAVPNTTSLTSVTFRSNDTIAVTGLGIYFFSVNGQRMIAEFRGTEGTANHMAFSPTGTRFAFVTSTGRVAVAQAPGFDNRQTLFFKNDASRLIVAWRTNFGVVVLPTVTIDIYDLDYEPRAVGKDTTGGNSNIYFQNSFPGPQEGTLAYWMLANDGVPTGTGALLYSIDNDWKLVTSGDVNQDGTDDLIFYNDTTNGVAVWFRGNSGITGTALIGIGEPGWEVGGVGAMGAGRSQLIWSKPSTGQVVSWSLSIAGAPIDVETIGFAPNTDWRLRGVGNSGVGSGILFFENIVTGQIYGWVVIGTTVVDQGTVGFMEPGWNMLGVGQLNP